MDPNANRRFSLTIPAALGALAIGIVVGGTVGFIAHMMFAKTEVVIPPPEVIQQEITDEQLATLCKDLTQDEKSKVVQAQERVVSLQSQLDAREKELNELKAKGEKDASRRQAAAKKWQEMEDEVARLRVELAAAEQERDEIRVELKKTLRDLDRQISETKKFKAKAEHFQAESTKNLWSAFLNNAKVEVCDRGTRKRHEKCHEAVETSFNDQMRGRFTTCVDTYQAVPVLKQADKGEGLPEFAEWLPDDNKFTKKGWYVIFCDPTLPEAKDIAEPAEINPSEGATPSEEAGGAEPWGEEE